ISQGVTNITEQMQVSMQAVLCSVAAVRHTAEGNDQAVDAMTSEAEKGSAMIMTGASISEKTAAGAEELSASAAQVSVDAQTVANVVAQQATEIERVSTSAKYLSAMMEETRQMLTRFRNFKWDRCENQAEPENGPWTQQRGATIQEAARRVWL